MLSFLPIRARSNQNFLRAIAVSKDRTLRITIRIETRKCDRTELKGDRSTGNFKVLSIAIAS
ncbi:hypothetical protein [Microcoleus sp. S13_C5]|uniref:hypothetical protein n=1 Tax=Microcoleus sp. S13_C5 TaxID=3055411 RepID=UPI002FD777E4